MYHLVMDILLIMSDFAIEKSALLMFDIVLILYATINKV